MSWSDPLLHSPHPHHQDCPRHEPSTGRVHSHFENVYKALLLHYVNHVSNIDIMLACNLSVLQKISVLDIAILTSTFWILYSNTQQYASPMGAVWPSQKWLTQGFDTYWESIIDHAVKKPFYILDSSVLVLEKHHLNLVYFKRKSFLNSKEHEDLINFFI